MEIGVTCVNPETTDFPSCAQKLSNGTWVSFIWPTLILLPILFVSFGELHSSIVDLVGCRYFKRWTVYT